MNKQQYEDLQQRLKQHHVDCIGNSCTASPIYLVQKKVIDWGYDEEYAEHHQLYGGCDDSYYDTVEEFFEDWAEESLENLFKGSQYCKEDFSEYDDLTGFGILDELLKEHEDYKYNGYQFVHGNERYETVNIFITLKSAEDFLKAKGWEYVDDGARIYVDSLYRSGEFRSLIDLIVSGQLEFK